MLLFVAINSDIELKIIKNPKTGMKNEEKPFLLLLFNQKRSILENNVNIINIQNIESVNRTTHIYTHIK